MAVRRDPAVDLSARAVVHAYRRIEAELDKDNLTGASRAKLLCALGRLAVSTPAKCGLIVMYNDELHVEEVDAIAHTLERHLAELVEMHEEAEDALMELEEALRRFRHVSADVMTLGLRRARVAGRDKRAIREHREAMGEDEGVFGEDDQVVPRPQELRMVGAG